MRWLSIFAQELEGVRDRCRGGVLANVFHGCPDSSYCSFHVWAHLGQVLPPVAAACNGGVTAGPHSFLQISRVLHSEEDSCVTLEGLE